MKKMLAVWTAAALLLGMAGCRNTEKTGATLQLDLSHSYVASPFDGEDISMPLFAEGQRLWIQNTDGTLSLYDTEAGTMTLLALHTQPDTSNYKDTTGICTVQKLPDGRYGILYNHNGIGANWGIAESAPFLDIYKPDLTYDETIELPTPGDKFCFQYNTTIMDSAGNWFFTWADSMWGENPVFYMANTDMTEVKPVDIGMNVSYLLHGKDGSVIGRFYSPEQGNEEYRRYDTASGKWESFTVDGLPPYLNRAVTGYGKYDLFVSDNTNLYGVTVSGNTGTPEIVMSFADSDFADGGSLNFYPTGEKRFLLWEYGEPTNYYLMRPRTDEELSQMTLLSLAGVHLSWNLRKDVCEFNRTHPDLRIIMRDYVKPEDEYPYTDAIDRFHQDLLSGVTPDIICTDGLCFESLAGKGLFEDLKPFMKQDDTFHEEDYLMNYFEALQYGGKQYQIGFDFSLLTMTGRTDIVGTRQGLTAAEFCDLIQSHPECESIFGEDSQETLLYFLGHELQASFVDRAAGTCAFDTPEFIQLLELTASLPTRDQIGDTDYAEYCLGWRDGRYLLRSTWMNAPIAWHEEYAGYYGKQDFTCIGYPGVRGNGGLFSSSYNLSMYAQSKQQDRIWEFFRAMLSEDFQKTLCRDDMSNRRAFPVRRDLLDDYMERSTAGSMRTMHLGNEITTGAATAEEMAALRDYLNGVSAFYRYDQTIDAIIWEECGKMTAGDQTPEQCAGMIQSRVSLYLSEQS